MFLLLTKSFKKKGGGGVVEIPGVISLMDLHVEDKGKDSTNNNNSSNDLTHNFITNKQNSRWRKGKKRPRSALFRSFCCRHLFFFFFFVHLQEFKVGIFKYIAY